MLTALEQRTQSALEFFITFNQITVISHPANDDDKTNK